MVQQKTKQKDVWSEIDEIEEKYADLIEDVEDSDPRQLRYPKMKVTGASTREIPHLREKRKERHNEA